MQRDELLHPAVEADLRRRKSRLVAARQYGVETANRLNAQPRNRDGKLGGFVFNRVEPVRVGTRLFQKPVPRAQRSLQGIDAAGVLGVHRKNQSIEKTPAL